MSRALCHKPVPRTAAHFLTPPKPLVILRQRSPSQSERLPTKDLCNPLAQRRLQIRHTSAPEGAAYISPGRKSGVSETKDNSTLPKAIAGERSSQATQENAFRQFVRAGQRLAQNYVHYQQEPNTTDQNKKAEESSTDAATVKETLCKISFITLSY
jgi:hypothetical protein